MARSFEFSDTVKREAFFRQWNLCAHCGVNLVDEYDNAHHILPNQAGNSDNKDHDWIRSADNCVILCNPCHDRVHGNGHFKNGPVAPPEYFPFSHGRQKFLHHSWANKMSRLFWKS